MEEKLYKFTIKLQFERMYNENTYYGVIDFYTDDEVPLTKELKEIGFESLGKRSGTLTGNMQKLEFGVDYKVEAIIKQHKVYGQQYVVRSIISELPKTEKQQKLFLKSILSKNQSDNLLKAYPTIVDKIINNEHVDLNLIKGIKEKTYEKIKKKVFDNYVIQEILVLLMPIGVTYRTIVKMLDIENNPVILKKKILENPYILTKVRGLGFAKVDSIALKLNSDLEVSRERTIAFIDYKLKEIASSNGDTWINRNTLKKEISSKISKCMHVYDEIVSENEESPNLLIVNGKMIGLKMFYNMEKNILKTLYQLDTHPSIFDNPTEEEINISIKQTEMEQGFEFTDEQKNAIINSVNHNVIIITSPAGGGKTSVAKGVINLLRQMRLSEEAITKNMLMLDAEQINEYERDYGDEWLKNKELRSFYKTHPTTSQVALAARACKRIEQVTKLPAMTIHRTLGFDGHRFVHNEENKLNHDINLIDEMSMVNISLLNSYFQSIKMGSKLILIYDFAQLPAIGAGDMSRDLLNSDLCINKFTKVHRQGEKSGILMDANKIRIGENPIEELKPKITHGELNDMHYLFSNNAKKIEEVAIKRYVSATEELSTDDVVLITPKRKSGNISCVNLNKKIQNILLTDNSLFVKQIKYSTETLFKVGSKVINRENDYSRGIFNGDIGYIKEINIKDKLFKINFIDLKIDMWCTFEEISCIDLAYCMSVHSMQGSQAHTIINVFDTSAFIMLNRKLLYTAITRAEKRCLVITQPKAFKSCIDDMNNRPRKTWTNEYYQSVIDFEINVDTQN